LLKKIRDPILFQGNVNDNEYFEGWYYKQVSKDEKTAISFIPGVSSSIGDVHSFVQYIYVSLDEKGGKVMKTGYFKYPSEDFVIRDKPFMVGIENNRFTESEITVELKDNNINVEGTLKLDSFLSIRKSVLMPNIMGFFAYLPKMECYHGVVSMNHMLHGSLNIDHAEIDFNNGKGYIEKDWGTSFPKKYIWIQCNNFKDKNSSLFFSVAEIPFMGKCFSGHICNLVIDKTEYRFATYNRSKLNMECITDQKITLSLENNNAKLRIEADRTNTGELMAPQQGKMQKTIKQGLSGEVRISLLNKQHETIYEDAGIMAGIEISGF